METLRDFVGVWSLLAFIGAMVWWAATMSRDVNTLKNEVHNLKHEVNIIDSKLDKLLAR